jgi:hypothetical protein
MSLIDETGNYLTRDGRLVYIDKIVPLTSSWEAKGTIYTPRKGKPDRADFSIWKTSGQYMAVGEHCRDIISKEQP